MSQRIARGKTVAENNIKSKDEMRKDGIAPDLHVEEISNNRFVEAKISSLSAFQILFICFCYAGLYAMILSMLLFPSVQGIRGLLNYWIHVWQTDSLMLGLRSDITYFGY
jgi:hypothetical protein